MKNLIFLYLLFYLTGCELLETRDAELPESGRANYVVPTSPELLFDNLKNSFLDKVQRNYEVCFVDTSFLNRVYKYIPSAGSAAQYNILNEWNLEAEKQYFFNLINAADNATVSISLFNENSTMQGDSARYNFDYRITIPDKFEDIPVRYEGSSQFKINIDANNLWVITEWTDIKIEDFPSWSDLKGRFYLF